MLEGLTALWLLTEAWGCRSRGLPSFVRERWLLSTLIVACGVASALRGGIEWGFAPLLDRISCAALALCFFWYFRREGLGTQRLQPPVAAATAVAVGVGLATLDERRETPAFFGNANLAAQFLGFALLILAFAPGERERGRLPLAIRALLGLAGGVYLCLLGTRSVALGLAAAALARAVTSARTRRLAAPLLSAGALAAVALAVAVLPIPARDASHKAESGAARLAVWDATLRLIRDYPFGVGTANFSDSFLPYQAQGSLPPREAELYQTPHNEYLRVIAEDGIPFGVMAAILVARLLVGLLRRPSLDRREQSPAVLGPMVVFLGIECLFQFPLMVATGATMAALTAGLALAAVEPRKGPPGELPPQAPAGAAWAVATGVTAALMLVALGRVVSSDYLSASGADRLETQERACRLNPRNLRACVTSAWIRGRAGDAPGARSGLERVLGRAPHYPPALKLLGELALQEGRAAEGCRVLSRYDALFVGRSSVRELLRRHCAGGATSAWGRRRPLETGAGRGRKRLLGSGASRA